MTSHTTRPKRNSIRARMLAIVLIPSAALLIIGGSAAGYLVHQGYVQQNWAKTTAQSSTLDIVENFTVQFGEERTLSLRFLGGDNSVADQLHKQRNQDDGSLKTLFQLGQSNIASNADAQAAAKKANDVLEGLVKKLPQMRQGIDARQVSAQDVYMYYNSVIDILSLAQQGVAATSPDPTAALAEATASKLFSVAESMSRSNALAVGAVGGSGLTPQTYQEFAQQVGYYHAELESLTPQLTSDEQAQYAKLSASGEWKQLTSMENAIIQRGPGKPVTTPPLPVPTSDWQNAASQVHAQLLKFYPEHHSSASNAAYSTAHRTFVNSLLAGIGILLIAIIAALAAALLSNRMVKRLKSLRAETLELAEERLPRLVDRFRSGEQVDVDAEVPPLDYGHDEIGQVADAFNKAQHTAVSAAAQEAKTRGGVNSVFLNIAHRSQVVVHRQLEVLDKAERAQEDPDQLDLLFQLDHLATRARRNSENLVILGGELPARKWRNPVKLMEIVRSAIAETEHYRRVNVVRLPNVSMVGSVVADLVHLLAELVDNATSFSPQDSRVEVRGNIIGKGLAIEIEDQGIGIPDEEREQINATLHNPPDFGVMALGDDSRLGLFVVSQLAARHGIGVTLVESVYGGIRAIVLVRAPLIAQDSSDGQASGGAMSAEGTTELPRPRRAPSEARIADQASAPTAPTPPIVPQASQDTDATVRWPTAEPADRPGQAPSASANGNGHGVPSAAVPTGPPPLPRRRQPEPDTQTGLPPLPRRRRQANLAPQLVADAEPVHLPDVPSDAEVMRTAERARSMMGAFQRGTQRGREASQTR